VTALPRQVRRERQTNVFDQLLISPALPNKQ
jgi:hypothetical protein